MDPLAFRRSLLGHGIGRKIVLLSFAGEPVGDFVVEKTEQARNEMHPDSIVVDLSAVGTGRAGEIVGPLRAWHSACPDVELIVVATGTVLEALRPALAEAGAGPVRIVRTVGEALGK
jgi:hypothetical protein